MALQSNGQLLVRHSPASLASLTAMQTSSSLTGYRMEPLFARAPSRPGVLATLGMGAAPASTPIWSLAAPTVVVQRNPWDVAHEAAAGVGYSAYVEPDIMHALRQAPPRAAAASGFIPAFPPSEAVSPGWHLGQDFTGFINVRGLATGNGVRIAHLDTGYTPQHVSTPRNIRPDLGWNFYSNDADTVDPGTQFLGLDQPGHGTATLALLAGNAVNLTFLGENYAGDIGGAPDAEIVPVLIGPSVVHFYSSTVARSLDYVLAPRGDPANKCQVVSLSHGGLPSAAWADAVNKLYSAGVVVVAASGDFFRVAGIDLATQFTVYPAAFNRVITALGATFANAPYSTDANGVLQGSWGPPAIMEKAIAAFTPNVAWMSRDHPPDGFTMDGAGTSSSTPQVAAACALWLEQHGARFPSDWSLVEACRVALFESAQPSQAGREKLGWGTLDVPAMLSGALADQIAAKLTAGSLRESPPDDVSFPFWRELVGAGPPGSAQEEMYETECAQVVLSSMNPVLVKAAQAVTIGGTLGAADRGALSMALKNETISAALLKRLG